MAFANVHSDREPCYLPEPLNAIQTDDSPASSSPYHPSNPYRTIKIRNRNILPNHFPLSQNLTIAKLPLFESKFIHPRQSFFPLLIPQRRQLFIIEQLCYLARLEDGRRLGVVKHLRKVRLDRLGGRGIG